jgi:predicted Zn-ribbon and HTH transcriptional regulator
LIFSLPYPAVRSVLGVADTVTSKGGKESDALARAVGAIVEGLTFYDLANSAVAEVRVKVAFEELGRRKKDQLTRLEGVTGPTARDAAVMPGIYPLDAVATVECYVCGYVAETKAMPSQCPNCGAARYAFEKEIALAKAWEIAADADRRSAVVLRASAAAVGGPTKDVLEALAREADGQADAAAKQLAELRT